MAARVQLTPRGGMSVAPDFDLQVIAEPTGIESITVRDAGDFPVSGVPELGDGCPTIVEVVLPGISTYRLPLFVEVVECGSEEAQTFGPLYGTGPDGDRDVEGPPRCNPLFATPPTARCLGAAEEAREARDAAREQCDRNQEIKEERDRHRDWATRLWIAAGAALALAVALVSSGYIGAIISIAFFAAAAGLTYAAVVTFGLAERWGSRLEEGMARFRELRGRFEAARDEAGHFCCPGQAVFDASDLECET